MLPGKLPRLTATVKLVDLMAFEVADRMLAVTVAEDEAAEDTP